MVNTRPEMSLNRNLKSGPKWTLITTAGFLVLIELGALALGSPAQAQAQPVEQPRREFGLSKAASASGNAAKAEQPDGIVVGRVIDPMGKGVPGADVVLMRDRESVLDEVPSDDDGRFTFVHVSPGSLQLRIIAEGFATAEIPGTMVPGENYVFPEVKLLLTTQITEIRVSPPPDEIAQEQFKDEITQRVFGIVPNFYVSYAVDAAPLTPKQKFHLALKASTDPVTISAVSIVAGVNQASDRFSGYGKALKVMPSATAPHMPTLPQGYSSEVLSCHHSSSKTLATSTRGPARRVRASFTRSPIPSLLRATINAGSQTILRFLAISLRADYRICIYRKETIMVPS